MSTSWNPADKGADITLSTTVFANDTATGSAATWNSVRATTSNSSGKFYLEMKCLNAGTQSFVGMATSGFSLATFLGNAATSVGMENTTGAGTIIGNGFTLNATVSNGYGANDTLQIAVDFTGGNLWFGKNNTWQTGNPSTGTTPTATFTPPLTLFPASSELNTNSVMQIVPSNFKFTPPTGFQPWDSTAFFLSPIFP